MGDETGLALAEAIKQNQTLKSFSVYAWGTRIGDETGLALAEAIKQNQTLKSFSVYAGGTQMGDETGVALAEAIKQNQTLKSFSVDAGGTQMGDETGLALAEAIKQNQTLKSFSVDAQHTQMGDETGVALAEAIKQNQTLRSFSVDAQYAQMGDETGVALAEAIKQFIARNRAFVCQSRTLLQLAPLDDSTGCRSLREATFRCMVLEFLVPSECLPFRLSSRQARVLEELSIDPLPCAACPGSRASHEEPVLPNAEKDEQLHQAIAESMAEEQERANSDLAAAMVRSKADGPASLNADGVVVFRLTRCARAEEVAQAILSSPNLTEARALVHEAGCALQPEWACGAWLLLPLTCEQFQEAGLKTGPVHIVALMKDEEAVKSALKNVPKEKRPKLRLETLDGSIFHDGQQVDQAEHSDGLHVLQHQHQEQNVDTERFEIIVDRTFVHFPTAGLISHSSSSRRSCKSSPL